MPEEAIGLAVLEIAAVTIVLVTFFVQLFKFLRVKHGQRESKAEGSSLTTSELEALVYRAVAEATVPLASRLAALEDHLGDVRAPRLGQPEGGDLLDLDAPATPEPIRRRPSQHA